MREYSTLHMPAQAHSMDGARPKSFGRRLRPDKRAEMLAAIIVAVLFTVCGAVYFCADLLSGNLFYNNIYIDGVNVGGKSLGDVKGLFSEQGKVPNIGVMLDIDGKKWNITARDVSAHYDTDKIIEKAYKVGREGGVLQKLSDILSLRTTRRDFTSSATYDDKMLPGIAERIAREIYRPATNATMVFQPEKAELFLITDENAGRSISTEVLAAQLKSSLDQGVIATLSMKSDAIVPEITKAMYVEQTQLIGSFTTALKPDAPRSKNIRLAGEAVNGAVLYPGDEFSFNVRTGERTKEKGYVDAPTISGSQLVDAPGGGVCQVSTTIYNAALLAGLEVVERHHHTWPVSYVGAGQDATVDWPSKDLRLKNSSDETMYLIFRVDEKNEMVTAEFYGMPGIEAVSVKTEGYETITPDAPLKFSNLNKPIGWTKVRVPARNGCTVNVYRVFTSSTGERRVFLYKDVYPTQRGELEIGTKPSNGESK